MTSSQAMSLANEKQAEANILSRSGNSIHQIYSNRRQAAALEAESRNLRDLALQLQRQGR